MKNKYFYPIFKLKAKSWIRYWLLKKTEFKGKLSEILTGFSFNLQNTLRQKFVKFEIEGNSIQDGEPSPENEVPIESAGDNVNELDSSKIHNNGGLYFIGTNYWYANNNLTDCIELEANKTYTFSVNEYVSDNRYTLMNSEKTALVREALTDTKKVTFTTTQQCWFHYYANGLTQQPQWKLEKGTVASPWSPFGMGSITEKIVNRNIYDKTKLVNGYYNNQGIFTNSTYWKTLIIDVENKSNVVISGLSGTTDASAVYYKFDKNMNKISSIGYYGSTLLNVANAKYINVTIKASEIDNNIQIEYGSTATDYISHEEQTYTIPTQQPFRSIGDVRDVFFKNTVDSPYYDENLTLNGWYERHYIVKYVFTGNEEFWLRDYSQTNQRYYFYNKITENLAKASCELMSNYFLDGRKIEDRTVDDFIVMASNSNVCIYINQFSTVEELKTWLSSNNVELYYEAKTPTDIPCTQSQIDILENRPSTYEGQTNVYSTDVVVPYLEIQYWESDTNG